MQQSGLADRCIARMEGSMNKPMHKRMLGYDYREHELHLGRATEAATYWLTAAALIAFLAAGVIVYRSGNPELRTVAGATTTVAQGNPAADQQRR
jgi:hypothetical protein